MHYVSVLKSFIYFSVLFFLDLHVICFELKRKESDKSEKTHILMVSVLAVAQDNLIADIESLISDLESPENQNGCRESQSENPESRQHPREHPAVRQRADALRPHYCHQPVETHQHDQKYGSIHVGAAEVE